MRISVGKKLGLGFSIVIVLMAVSSVIAYNRLTSLNESVEVTVYGSFPSTRDCSSLANELNESVASLRGYIIFGDDPQQVRYFKDSLAQTWRNIDSLLNTLKERSGQWANPDELKKLAEIENLMAQLSPAVEEVANLTYGSPEWDHAGELMESQTIPTTRRARALIDELVELLNADVSARRDDIAANAKVVTFTLLGGSLIAAIIAAVVGTVLSRRIVSGLQAVSVVASQVAQGDLRGAELDTPSDDEIGELAGAFNTMRAGLRDMASQIRQATENVNSNAAEVLASTQQQAAAAKEQAATIQEITSTLEEVNQSGTQIGDRAKQVATTVENASGATQRGMAATQQTSQNMETVRDQVEEVAENIVSLSERTQTIGEIIATVSEISEQSNLLALNASIEAVSAGEQGGRFTVVAHEMKNLADRAKDCTVQVRTILGEIQKGINTSVMLTEEAVKRADGGKQQAHATEVTIREMTQTNEESIAAFQQIVAGANQQQIGVNQVTQGMQDIRQAINQTVAGTQQMEKAAVNMNALSQQLHRLVEKYQV